MQNKSLMFQVCMVLFMLLVAPVKGLAQGVTISGQVTDDMDVVLTSSSCHPKIFVKEFCYFLMPCH